MTQRERKAWNAANRREFIEAGFSRRDLFKMGLLTGAGYLVAKGGLSARADEQTQLRGGQSMIFMVPKFTGAAYFAATEKGAKEAVAELKGKGVAIDFLYTGPSVANTDEEIGMIDDLVAQKADAIIIAPNHADAMVPVAKKASLRSAEMRRIRPFPSPFEKGPSCRLSAWHSTADPRLCLYRHCDYQWTSRKALANSRVVPGVHVAVTTDKD